MKKCIALLMTVLLSVVVIPAAMAAEEVSTNYFKEDFGTPSEVAEQALSLSTSAGYGNWRLAADNYETAKSEGTEISIVKESDTNNVLRTLRTSGYNADLAQLEAGQKLSGIPTTDVLKLSFRMQYLTNTHNIMMRGVFGALRKDWVSLESGGHRFTPANDEQTAKLTSMNVWHTYELVIDYNANTTTLYVDGLQIGDKSSSSVIIKNIGFLQPRNSMPGDVYFDDISIDHITKIASYKADSIQYTTQSGAFTSAAQSGGLLKQAYISKADTASGQGTAIFAVMDKDNRLQAIKVADFTADDFDENNSALITVDMSLPNNADLSGGRTNVFFFEGLATLNPLEEPSSFDIPADKTPTLFLLGDSVAANYNSSLFPRAGIGMMLGDYFTAVIVNNQSVSGAGTDTVLGLESADFNHKYKWDAIQTGVTAGDYVYIPLGVNDCFDGIGTANYIRNLDEIVTTLNEKSVNVILGGFVMLHRFDSNGKFRVTFDESGKFTDTDIFITNGEDYHKAQQEYIAAKKAANTPGITSVNLAAATAELIGPDSTPDGEARKYYIYDAYYNWDTVYSSDSRASASRYNPETGDVIAKGDDVHLSLYGAAVYAKELAKEIAKLDIPLADYVTNLDKEITYPNFEFKYSDEQ